MLKALDNAASRLACTLSGQQTCMYPVEGAKNAGPARPPWYCADKSLGRAGQAVQHRMQVIKYNGLSGRPADGGTLQNPRLAHMLSLRRCSIYLEVLHNAYLIKCDVRG